MPKKQIKTETQSPMTSRIQPITQEELEAAIRARSATTARKGRMEEYNQLVRDIVAAGQPVKLSLNGEKSLRELSLRIGHAARRENVNLQTFAQPDDTLIVNVKPAKEPEPAPA